MEIYLQTREMFKTIEVVARESVIPTNGWTVEELLSLHSFGMPKEGEELTACQLPTVFHSHGKRWEKVIESAKSLFAFENRHDDYAHVIFTKAHKGVLVFINLYKGIIDSPFAWAKCPEDWEFEDTLFDERTEEYCREAKKFDDLCHNNWKN